MHFLKKSRFSSKMFCLGNRNMTEFLFLFKCHAFSVTTNNERVSLKGLLFSNIYCNSIGYKKVNSEIQSISNFVFETKYSDAICL